MVREHTYKDTTNNISYGSKDGLHVAVVKEGVALKFVASEFELKSIQRYFDKFTSDVLGSPDPTPDTTVVVSDYSHEHTVSRAFPRTIENTGAELTVLLWCDMYTSEKLPDIVDAPSEEKEEPERYGSHIETDKVICIGTGESYYGPDQALEECKGARAVLIISDIENVGIEHIASDGWTNERMIFALRKILNRVEREVFRDPFDFEDEFDD